MPERPPDSLFPSDTEQATAPTAATPVGDPAAGAGYRRSDRHKRRGRGKSVPARAGGAPAGKWSVRRVLRWIAALMIVGGFCLLCYPIATWGYTWYEQRQLKQELLGMTPGLAAAAAALESGDMVSAPSPPTTAPAPPAAGASLTPTTVDPVEAERLAQLAAFKLAADAFAEEVGWQKGEPVGRVIIPSIGVDVVMIEGADDRNLREGPGHWPETPFPGQGGNFVLSGHRTTYGAPFRKLDKVQIGDEIDLVLPYGVARYIVTKSVIVYPKEVKVVAQVGKEQVSLAACHPILSAKQRIVVQGDLVSFKLLETPAD